MIPFYKFLNLQFVSFHLSFFMNENIIYQVGGFAPENSCEQTCIYMINYEGVTNLAEAKSRQWTHLGALQHAVQYSGVELYENKLYVTSRLGSKTYYPSISTDQANSIQIFDLETNTSQTIEGVYERGLDDLGLLTPITFIHDTKLVVVGGKQQNPDSMEQRIDLTTLGVSTTVSEKINEATTVFKRLGSLTRNSDYLRFEKRYTGIRRSKNLGLQQRCARNAGSKNGTHANALSSKH